MAVAIITGSCGLVGSEAVTHFATMGLDIVGIDNDMRREFFGEAASTAWMRDELERKVRGYTHVTADIRDRTAIEGVFRRYGADIALVIHAAAQPSHDWAARDPHKDFGVNAVGTLTVLEATRQFAPDAVFIFTSTNKVYGDRPNSLPLVELETRWELDPSHAMYRGIDETMSIDATTHSVFGASKVAADVLVQEYGRYFGMRTGCFRGGCLTGPNHSGAMLHGFLAYLVRCAITRTRYTVFGYKAKQVRDNIHSADLNSAFEHFFRAPRVGEVYNMGGGRDSNCSMLEAIAICERITERPFEWNYDERSRVGDHIWYISDLARFKSHYPGWKLTYSVTDIVEQIYDANRERWSVPS